ncbi:hypothetical protein [Adlercreutzia caecimuris]|uniref:HEAT repeat domain-containing protein n=2 Tax=Adlercreutzia caecimuris TaxID=671266 RepID=R9KUE8_9ACTN|nr:hypothetical protein [Adlercreutzia caecimuris]EOS49821.1 hypothetical protein C811_02286 [Adlercreutzia caecimuris B7]MCI9207521.1 hypothetical protein [Adlercreutzia caecimuris]MCR2038209.1 hypothetical protein [Adlercreutzia caecimuris]NBJ67337.1 hypothetical protein [Adlercreutzia caecimuris]THG36921.1 hypothetical protein E5986_07555 [Adlercreutzia caecimuris]
MKTQTPEEKKQVEEAIANPAALNELIEALSGGSRRGRQQAAKVIAAVAAANSEILVPHAAALVDALERPEAQTRWECLDTLAQLVPLDGRTCEKAVPGAETALFDEDSGPLRLAAMRFLCRLGATTEKRSEKVWPLIDEGIQCWHGDLEFQDMLIAIIDFSQGKLAPEVKAALADRMRFDATNGRGMLKKRAIQIVENCEK